MEPAGPCGHCPPGEAKPARYTCPRCNVPYCSLPCYRAHGACAEAFYRDQVLGELRGRTASPSRLAGALRRLRQQREAEAPQDGQDLEGLGGLWERLQPAEKAAFERLLSRGEAGRLLPPWRPWWWSGGAPAPLLEELRVREEGEEAPEPAPAPQNVLDPAAAPPPVPDTIRALAQLSGGRAPSPLLCFQLPNVLFAYAHAQGLYHGGLDDDPELLLDQCSTVLGVAGALGARQVFRSTREALHAAAHALRAGAHPPGPLGARGAMREAARLLLGENPQPGVQKGYSLAALAQLARAFGRARSLVPAGRQRERLYRARKKCQYLLSWTNEHEDALTPLALDCAQEYRAEEEEAGQVEALSGELERLWGGPRPPAPRTLIQELA
ncbi:zinc finger HIT domain-containing protein 2 [Phascolarctos cinereus]|uniref:Zinc finger HIT domain-containing protein 2 n=1 Tax=Phascolarctos cinereus TaxID=38626 RepID=A0A6P5IYN0_PHACI|nr:zinc finger HIT domain-containing protein 2 [Phascolarctos cinereus]